jgi:lysylphosphatidylglycerol synthetase-like protein (DUF2156 family)
MLHEEIFSYTNLKEFDMQRLTARSRPLGITIISIIMAILGIFDIIGGILSMGSNGTLAIITLIIGVLYLILAWGLWTVQTWAFWGTVILAILTIINSIIGLGHGVPATGWVSLILAVIVLIYMFADRNVRAAFRA